jgi:hypothetical protein
MAFRKQRLKQRITAQSTNSSVAAAGGHPPVPGTPMEMPLAQVVVGMAPGGQYSVGYQEYSPLYTPGDWTGGAIPQTAPGQWDQLRAAGRP